MKSCVPPTQRPNSTHLPHSAVPLLLPPVLLQPSSVKILSLRSGVDARSLLRMEVLRLLYNRCFRSLCTGRSVNKNKAMVEYLLCDGMFKSEKVAKVMETIDRGLFVQSGASAYIDSPMQIGYNATISAPHMHATCLELLEQHLQPGMRALDVGSGTGYLTACFAILVGPQGRAVGVEHIPELASLSVENIKKSAASSLLKEGSLSVHISVQAMLNEAGPNFIGYFKHLASELLMDSETVQLPFPEFKKERLKVILDESVDCIIQETDTIKDQIIALSCLSQNSHECIKDCGRKRKALSSPSKDSGSADILNQKSVGKVYNDTGALQGITEIDLKALEKYSAEAQAKLDKMEEGLEEFLNSIFSKCRPMTRVEKERLGWQIKKLPAKALDRVVEIVLHHNPSEEPKPSEVLVDLEALDDTTLWRLYYHVQNVLGINKLSSCSPMPLPLF